MTRITHQTIQQRTLANIQANLHRMSDLQSQLSSGKKIEVASNDPAAAASAMRLRTERGDLAQIERNVSDADSWLTTIDTALQSALAVLNNARDLVVQGGNGALGQTSREAIATNIEGLRDSLLGIANTSYLGRNVFAGTSNAAGAFAAAEDGTYPYQGSGAPVERRISEAVSVRVDSDGRAVFGTPEQGNSVFALLDDIVAELRTPTGNPTSRLDALDSRMESVRTELSALGARQRQVQTAQATLTDAKLTNTTRLSEIEDVDLAKVLLDLQVQEVAYKGALSAGARVLQPSLLDFLR
ncbi:flagellar hook-associated protein 3 [Xylanimonas oleitrophica]|uniref:Flagellar hook-associated protein 3 n=1 Tax=Xylanimonas oleitrophica TaxID=2607479 RepID=A0A2W5X0C3_9MICO|nr:flagellar hook-associated protein FlgL [Xylanimonas oleitrophica]PZR54116.1 flagellar hook-associated protein 3 [Xylanimonas oleitrophica]